MKELKYHSTIDQNDVNSMFHTIWQFKEAANRCGQAYPITISNASKVLFVLQIVNLAFAVELEMKMLSLQHKGRYICNSHNLLVLFLDLPDEIIEPLKKGDTYNYLSEKLNEYENVFSDVR